MPEENSRMDELLKAYAKKRRGEAGAPFELHPATRQMLQGEVKRTLGKNAAAEKSSRFRLWPALALSSGIAAVVVAGLFVLQSRTARESVGQMAATAPGTKSMEAMDEISSAPVQQAPSPTSATTADNLAQEARAARDAKELFTLKERSEGVKNKSDQAVAGTASPPSEPARIDDSNADLLAKAEAQSPRQESAAAGSKVAAPAIPPAAAAQPNVFYEQEAKSAKLRSAPAEIDFVQQSVSDERKNLLSLAAPRILTEFKYSQVGDSVRIVDADGSVYEGVILAEADRPGSKDVDRRLMQQKENKPLNDLAGKQKPAQTNFFFRVSGTNQSLQQLVTCSGEVVVPASGVTGVEEQPAKADALKRSTAADKRAVLSPGRIIRGKVNVGGTNEFELNAVPRNR